MGFFLIMRFAYIFATFIVTEKNDIPVYMESVLII